MNKIISIQLSTEAHRNIMKNANKKISAFSNVFQKLCKSKLKAEVAKICFSQLNQTHHQKKCSDSMSYQINIYYQNSRKTIILNWLSTSFNPIECIDLFEKNQLDIIVAIRIFKLSTIKNQKIESKSKYNCLVKLASLYAPDQIMNSYQLYQSSDIKFLLIEVLLFSLVVNKSDTTINKNILDDVINRIRYLNYDFFNLSTLHDFHQSFGEYLFQDHQSKSIQKVLFQFKNIIGYIFQNRWFDFIINNNDENRFLLDRPSYENPKERITEIQILNFLKNMNKYLEFKVSYDYLSVKSITLTEHDILHPVDNVFTIDTYMKSIVILNRIITLFHESDEKIEIEKEVKTILGLLESDIDMILPIETQSYKQIIDEYYYWVSVNKKGCQYSFFNGELVILFDTDSIADMTDICTIIEDRDLRYLKKYNIESALKVKQLELVCEKLKEISDDTIQKIDKFLIILKDNGNRLGLDNFFIPTVVMMKKILMKDHSVERGSNIENLFLMEDNIPAFILKSKFFQNIWGKFSLMSSLEATLRDRLMNTLPDKYFNELNAVREQFFLCACNNDYPETESIKKACYSIAIRYMPFIRTEIINLGLSYSPQFMKKIQSDEFKFRKDICQLGRQIISGNKVTFNSLSEIFDQNLICANLMTAQSIRQADVYELMHLFNYLKKLDRQSSILIKELYQTQQNDIAKEVETLLAFAYDRRLKKIDGVMKDFGFEDIGLDTDIKTVLSHLELNRRIIEATDTVYKKLTLLDLNKFIEISKKKKDELRRLLNNFNSIKALEKVSHINRMLILNELANISDELKAQPVCIQTIKSRLKNILKMHGMRK